MNNGKGIPVVEHKDEKMFVPTMIFGHLLTSSNFNDEEQKVKCILEWEIPYLKVNRCLIVCVCVVYTFNRYESLLQ